ncbi:hypothetical protein Prum_068430 [Phytohabitans rumicis]|uniref:Uncharacterized protein n=1 Tax=Phytohabitans rumicis TaxID=1076125 RepID=A0A6V8LEG3_9ACTN|nr:hypothetical protein Prum_068430 [Phytohabitans rumicis]
MVRGPDLTRVSIAFRSCYRLRRDLPGDLVSVIGRGQPGPNVEDLPDALLGDEVPDHPAQNSRSARAGCSHWCRAKVLSIHTLVRLDQLLGLSVYSAWHWCTCC